MPQSQDTKRRPEQLTPGNTNSSGKRSRVSRACDQCRTAREKCDGHPTCSTCSAAKRACTYTTNPKKRGIQPGYIRTLELALTWLFNNSDAESLLNEKLAQEGGSSILLERDSKESNKLHKNWRRSKFCKDIEKLLSGEDIGQVESRSPETDEDSDTEEPSHQSTRITASTNTVSVVRETAQPKFDSQPLLLHTGEDGSTQLPLDRWTLFDIYFGYTHCWFPVCEKHDILKLSYSYPEQGLVLSPNMAESGNHAELWSILALASLQDGSRDSVAPNTSDKAASFPSARIYNIARSLIPLELGMFELGHVKALLILALVNLSQSHPEAAWLLVGHASRIIAGFEQHNLRQPTRFPHVFAGCFLLDNLISMQLQRRPYFRASDMERIGKVFEDSEEWQPWTGCLGLMPASSHTRAPVLNLSTFNSLVDLSSIISLTDVSGSPRNNLQEAIGRVELWKASLPPMFEHIRTDRVPIPHAPPALLLQLLYHCCCLLIYSSQSWAQRIIELLARFREDFGLVALPSIANCLFETVQRNRAFSALDGRSQAQFLSLRREFHQSWKCTVEVRSPAVHPTSAHSRQSFGSSNLQIPTPESIHIPFNPAFSATSNPRTNSALLDELLPDMTSTTVSQQPQAMGYNNGSSLQGFNAPHFDRGFNPPSIDHHDSTTSRDIESFFDELASLDGAERVQTQDQFMQNLGFAPDANMSDLFTTDFGNLTQNLPPFQQGQNDLSPLDQNTFFQGG